MPLRYKENAMKLSALMYEHIELDRPLEKAVKAIEYVIRHRGAPLLRPASCRLTMFEREGMDVILVLLLLTLFISYLIVRIFSSVTSKVFERPKSDRLKKKVQ